MIPPVYHREGTTQGDVVFPFFWWMRGPGWHTWIVPPVWSHSSPIGHDFGIAPLFMTGRNRDSYYHIIPPLLTLAWGDEDEDYLFDVCNYVVMNPVKAGLCARPEDWPLVVQLLRSLNASRYPTCQRSLERKNPFPERLVHIRPIRADRHVKPPRDHVRP